MADDKTPAKESKKKENAKDEDEDEDSASEDESAEEEEEKPQPKKKSPPKKKSQKSRRKEEDSDEDDEEDENEEVARPKKKNKKAELSDLKDQAASMNPANLITALKNTPVNELQKVLPQMKKLTNMLDGTPMGPIFENLTSLLSNSSPQIWTKVFAAFPNFVETIIGNGTKLLAVGAKAAGGAAKSLVDVGDIFFDVTKDLFGQVTKLPGGSLMTPLGQVLDVAHSTILNPLDSVADELKASAKRQVKLINRANSRRRNNDGLW